MRLILSLILLTAPATPALAAIDLSLPLEGYYRPGRYFPLRVTVTAESATELIINGEDAVELRTQLAQGRAQALTPLLPLAPTLRQLRWHIKGGASGTIEPPMRALQPDQKLVGFTTADLTFAQQLFPNTTIIPIRLDPAAPLPGPAAAWQTLDAALLTTAAAAQLDDSSLATLLAAGTTIAIRGQPPASNWPWRRAGDYSVLSHNPAGPPCAGVNAPAFAAVQGWEADWPAPFRARVLLYALIFAIVMLGLALMRLRWLPIIALAVSATTVLLLALWWPGHAPVLQRDGDIIVVHGNLSQIDAWTYLASATPTKTTIPASQLIHPVFEDDAARDAIALSLTCAPDGSPRFFTARVMPGLRLGFFSRSIVPTIHAQTESAPETNPLSRLARRVYLRPGDRVAGQLPGTAQRWPTLVIERPPPQLPTTQP